MKRVSEYNSSCFSLAMEESERIALATIDHIYQDIEDDSHATEEEVHTIKKCLEILRNVHDLRHLSKM